MLRLANSDRTSSVTVLDDVTLELISLTIRDKESLLLKMAAIGDIKKGSAIGAMIDIVAPAIKSMSGNGVPDNADVVLTLNQIEEMEQLQIIVKAVADHCSLTPAESKNSSSLSVQPTPDSAGNVEKIAEPDGAPVSTTPTKMEV